MKLIREWSFPVALMLAWIVATGYSVYVFAGAHREFTRVIDPGSRT